MKKLLPLLLALAAPLPVLAAGGYSASPIVFNGLIVQDGKTKVSLYNPNTGDAKWVVVGKKFGSYTVDRYQPGVPGKTADAVVLTLGTNSQRIQLQDSANLSSNTPVVSPTATATSAALTSALSTLNTLTDRLTQARNDPSSDPRTIQTLEQSIASAQQRVQQASANTAVGFTTGALTDANQPAASTRVQVSTVNGQQNVTVNGQTVITPAPAAAK